MLDQADEDEDGFVETATDVAADEVVPETAEDVVPEAEDGSAEIESEVDEAGHTDVLAVAEDEVHPYEAVVEAEDKKSKKKKNKKNKKNKKDKQEDIQEDISEEVKEDAEEVEDLLPIGEPVNSDDLYDDFEDDELDGLTGAENLDEILDREGIDISDGDTVGNIMEMFGAGFSIIEISKVLKLEVSEVKEIIDKEQG